MVQWLRLSLPTQGVWVPSLVEELNPTWLVAKKKKKTKPKPKTIKQKQYRNKFNKDFKKKVHIKKKSVKRNLRANSTEIRA